MFRIIYRPASGSDTNVPAGDSLQRAKLVADRLVRRGALYAIVVGQMASVPRDAVYHGVGHVRYAPSMWRRELAQWLDYDRQFPTGGVVL